MLQPHSRLLLPAPACSPQALLPGCCPKAGQRLPLSVGKGARLLLHPVLQVRSPWLGTSLTWGGPSTPKMQFRWPWLQPYLPRLHSAVLGYTGMHWAVAPERGKNCWQGAQVMQDGSERASSRLGLGLSSPSLSLLGKLRQGAAGQGRAAPPAPNIPAPSPPYGLDSLETAVAGRPSPALLY